MSDGVSHTLRPEVLNPRVGKPNPARITEPGSARYARGSPFRPTVAFLRSHQDASLSPADTAVGEVAMLDMLNRTLPQFSADSATIAPSLDALIQGPSLGERSFRA